MTGKKGRKVRLDSTAGRAALIASVLAGDLEPPAHVALKGDDLPFWRAVTRARARELWTEVDLVHAANLARCLADVERLQAELRAEGEVLVNDRGTPVANPKGVQLETLTRRSIALSRMLAITPRGASDNATRDEATAKRAQDETARAVAAAKSDDDDDLIPMGARLQ